VALMQLFGSTATLMKALEELTVAELMQMETKKHLFTMSMTKSLQLIRLPFAND